MYIVYTRIVYRIVFRVVWFGLLWFYGITTIVGNLKPVPFLYIQTVIFQTIQFSISIIFGLQSVKYQNSSISNNSV